MNIKLHYFISLLFCLFASTAFSQQPVEEWSRRYNGIGDHNETAIAIAVDAAGNSYVTGNTKAVPPNEYNFYDKIVIVKYSPTGEELWVNTVEADSSTAVTAIAVDSQGGVYITGRRGNWENQFDFVTIRYDASTGT
jgi:hypothetical protein